MNENEMDLEAIGNALFAESSGDGRLALDLQTENATGISSPNNAQSSYIDYISQASLQQAKVKADIGRTQEAIELGRATNEAAIKTGEAKNELYNSIQETLDDQSWLQYVPPIARAVGGLFVPQLNDEFYARKLYEDSSKMEALTNQQANLAETNQLKAELVAGFNPIGEARLNEAQAVASAIDAASVNRSNADTARYNAQTSRLDTIETLRKNPVDEAYRERNLAETMRNNIRTYDTNVAKNKTAERKNEIATDRLAFDEKDVLRQEQAHLENLDAKYAKIQSDLIKAGTASTGKAKSPSAQLKEAKEIADYQATVSSTSARAANNEARLPVLQRIDNGRANNPTLQASMPMYVQAQRSGDVVQQTSFREQGNKLYDDGVEIYKAGMNDTSKKILERRLENNGNLSSADRGLASEAFVSNFDKVAVANSIEATMIPTARNIFKEAITQQLDALDSTTKQALTASLPKGAKLDAASLTAMLNQGSSVYNDIKKHIDVGALLNQVFSTPVKGNKNLKELYSIELFEDYTKSSLKTVANNFAESDPEVGNQLKQGLAEQGDAHDHLAKFARTLFTSGYGQYVKPVFDNMKTSQSINAWHKQYMENAVTYDETTAMMLPLLGADNGAVNVKSIMDSKAISSSIDALTDQTTAVANLASSARKSAEQAKIDAEVKKQEDKTFVGWIRNLFD